jgi:hypothetical protein
MRAAIYLNLVFGSTGTQIAEYSQIRWFVAPMAIQIRSPPAALCHPAPLTPRPPRSPAVALCRHLAMSRPFDHGKGKYRKDHKARGDQAALHILADDVLQHYGANERKYKDWSHLNYHLGPESNNTRDRVLDNMWVRSIFKPGTHAESSQFKTGEYDATKLTKLAQHKITIQQQIDRLLLRFETAKAAYKITGEYKYITMQKDLRYLADTNLNVDLTEWRVSTVKPAAEKQGTKRKRLK